MVTPNYYFIFSKFITYVLKTLRILSVPQNIEKYSQKGGLWGNLTIMATASLLGIDIVVYTQMGPAKEWLTYPTSFSLCTQSDNAIYLENLGDHFNPVISVE